jgi:hypothetical protein
LLASAIVIALPLGGIFTNALSGATAILLGCTGLFGGAAHYASVLADRKGREIERATAYGFFIGFGLGALVLLLDALT